MSPPQYDLPEWHPQGQDQSGCSTMLKVLGILAVIGLIVVGGCFVYFSRAIS